MWKLNWLLKRNFKTGLWSTYSHMFYYPEVSRPTMRNMELWKLIIKFRNEHSGKKLSIKEKELFYQDAQKVLEKALFLLEKYTIPVTTTLQIAQVSAVNSDYALALTIAEAFEKVGPLGVKMIVEGNKLNDELEVTTGLQLNRVIINPMFITKCGIDVLNKCSLILYGDRLESIEEIKELINVVKLRGKPAVYIFSSCDRKALHDLVQMKLKEKLEMVAVELIAPDIMTATSLMDISIITGTKIIGNNFRDMPLEDCVGSLENLYFSEDEILMLGTNLNEDHMTNYISKLVQQYPLNDLPALQNKMFTLLNNKVALIKIGGIDKVYIRKRMGKAIDTLGRAEQAVTHGLIIGDGRCLLGIIEQVSKSITYSKQINGGTIVVDAMKFFYDLMHTENESYYHLSREKSVLVPKFFGFDKKSKQYINLIAEGILDPKSYFAQSLIFAKQKCMQYEKEAGRDSEDNNL